MRKYDYYLLITLKRENKTLAKVQRIKKTKQNQNPPYLQKISKTLPDTQRVFQIITADTKKNCAQQHMRPLL